MRRLAIGLRLALAGQDGYEKICAELYPAQSTQRTDPLRDPAGLGPRDGPGLCHNADGLYNKGL
ncbi:hypothetical protein D9M70_627590 [compost metagenome]